jgi:hypothetical protein
VSCCQQQTNNFDGVSIATPEAVQSLAAGTFNLQAFAQKCHEAKGNAKEAPRAVQVTVKQEIERKIQWLGEQLLGANQFDMASRMEYVLGVTRIDLQRKIQKDKKFTDEENKNLRVEVERVRGVGSLAAKLWADVRLAIHGNEIRWEELKDKASEPQLNFLQGSFFPMFTRETVVSVITRTSFSQLDIVMKRIFIEAAIRYPESLRRANGGDHPWDTELKKSPSEPSVFDPLAPPLGANVSAETSDSTKRKGGLERGDSGGDQAEAAALPPHEEPPEHKESSCDSRHDRVFPDPIVVPHPHQPKPKHSDSSFVAFERDEVELPEALIATRLATHSLTGSPYVQRPSPLRASPPQSANNTPQQLLRQLGMEVGRRDSSPDRAGVSWPSSQGHRRRRLTSKVLPRAQDHDLAQGPRSAESPESEERDAGVVKSASLDELDKIRKGQKGLVE